MAKKLIKVKKPTIEERLFARYNEGRTDAKYELQEAIRTRISAVAERRRLAFYTYQGALQTAHTSALKQLVETLDKLDREVNP